MTLAAKLKKASPADDPETLEDLARQARDEGEEEELLPLLGRALARRPTARLWQWRGLLERSLDRHELALRSFEEASKLAPRDVGIAHGRARIALEAGLDARGLYERARALAPNDGQIIVGHAAAHAAVGEGDAAAGDLADVLERAPAWVFGHEQLAQILATQGRAQEATRSVERALVRFPKAAPLWEALLTIETRRKAFEAIAPAIERARVAGVESDRFRIYDAIRAAELDDSATPSALFGSDVRNLEELKIWRVRHLLRTGAIDALLPMIDEELECGGASDIWAYAATAWRQSGDPRSEWLEGDSRFVAAMDLREMLPDLPRLAATLRSLHVAKGGYLDQSVLGGTQTDGPLLSRIDPIVQGLRTAIVDAVQSYVRQLPTSDSSHPLLRHRRDRRIRFAGSWSVRLGPKGRHSNHVHPQGWISSALYVSLPPQTPGDADDAGWFTLGQPDERLRLEIGPWRSIRPLEGQLVLFPSWMWHGTVPFAAGERLTVAFDVAPPL